MNRLSLCQKGVLSVLTSMLCIVLIINQRESSSQAQTNWKTVTLEGLLAFLSDCAAIPPVVEHSEACQFSPLPRSDPPWAP